MRHTTTSQPPIDLRHQDNDGLIIRMFRIKSIEVEFVADVGQPGGFSPDPYITVHVQKTRADGSPYEPTTAEYDSIIAWALRKTRTLGTGAGELIMVDQDLSA